MDADTRCVGVGGAKSVYLFMKDSSGESRLFIASPAVPVLTCVLWGPVRLYASSMCSSVLVGPYAH